MTRARNSADLASQGNLFADISNDRIGIGSVVPTHKLHVAGTSKFDDDVKFEGTTAALNISWDKSANILNFSDSTKLTVGDGNDLSLYHSSSWNYIQGSASGVNLAIQAKSGENSVIGIPDGKTSLYFNGNEKIETTNTGAKVTGNLEVTGVLTYDDVTSIDSVGIVTARAGVKVTGGNVELAQGTGTGYYQITQTNGNTVKFGIVSGSDIELSGSSNNSMYFKTNNTERLRIDSSGKIGISRTPTQHPLEIQHASEPTVSLWRGSTKSAALQAQSGGTYLYSYENIPLIFSVNSAQGFTERVRIDSNGHLGINVANATQLAASKMLTLRPDNDDGIRFVRPGDGNNSPNIHLDLTTTTSGSAFPSGEAYTTKYKTTNCDQIFETYEGGGTGGNISFRTRSSSGESLRINKDGYITKPANPVFHARLINHTNATQNPLIYDDVIVNVGSHYKSSGSDAGKFVVPVAGTYFFFWEAIKNSNSGAVTRLYLKKNGSRVYNSMHLRLQEEGAYANGCMNVIMTLAVGDKIHIELSTGGVHAAEYTHFGGYLIG